MDVDTERLRSAGDTHYPAMADEFRRCAKVVEDIEIKASGGGSDAEIALDSLLAVSAGYLRASGDHLEDCGEVLTKVAESYDAIDKDSEANLDKYHLDSPDVDYDVGHDGPNY